MRITTTLDRCMVKTTRHYMRRYEFPDDRKDLMYWVKAPGPCSAPYFWCNLERRAIVITLYRGDRAMAYDLRIVELEDTPHWRRRVAQAILEVRYALRVPHGD